MYELWLFPGRETHSSKSPAACCGILAVADSGFREQSVLGRDCTGNHATGLQRWLVPGGVPFGEPCGSGW